jgi:hypothetical protein
MANFRLFAADGNEKWNFVFLGWQIIKGNRRLMFQQKCLSLARPHPNKACSIAFKVYKPKSYFLIILIFQQSLITVYRLSTKENKLLFSALFAAKKRKFVISIFRLQQTNRNCSFLAVMFSTYINIGANGKWKMEIAWAAVFHLKQQHIHILYIYFSLQQTHRNCCFPLVLFSIYIYVYILWKEAQPEV